MKLGFLTACFPGRSLTSIADWASSSGFASLEVACWPDGSDRPFTASHLEVTHLNDEAAEAARSLLAARGLTISSLAYYDNNLHPDLRERQAVNAHTRSCIEAAARLGCPTVGTFIGRDPTRSVKENLQDAKRVFEPLVDRASELDIRIVIENCVMEGWHPDGYPGNLAYSPELWEWLFSLGLYLNFDPSHLVWMGIDPVAALRPYVEKVLHVQAKDIETFAERRTRYGYPGKAVERDDPWDVGWWRYRIPGLGEVDWTRLLDVLAEGGYDGVVSIEHEDPVWSGTDERIEAGLLFARRTLEHALIER